MYQIFTLDFRSVFQKDIPVQRGGVRSPVLSTSARKTSPKIKRPSKKVRDDLSPLEVKEEPKSLAGLDTTNMMLALHRQHISDSQLHCKDNDRYSSLGDEMVDPSEQNSRSLLKKMLLDMCKNGHALPETPIMKEEESPAIKVPTSVLKESTPEKIQEITLERSASSSFSTTPLTSNVPKEK